MNPTPSDDQTGSQGPPASSPIARRRETILTHRLLVFSGSAWLLASWILVIGLRRPLVPTIHTWLPGVRLMLTMSVLGLVVIWPMAAMATPRSIPPHRTLRESVMLLALAQLIVWPAGLVTAWPFSRTALMAAVLTAWGVLAAVVTAWGRQRPRPSARTAAMAICLMMMMAAPAVMFLDRAATGLAAWSPLTSLWSLAGGGLDPPTSGNWINVAILWALAAIAWGILLVWRKPSCQGEPSTRGLPT